MNKIKPDTDFTSLLATSIQDMQNSLGVLHGSLESAYEISQNVKPVDLFATLQYETSRISSELFQMRVLQGLQSEQLVPQVDQHYVAEMFEELMANNYVLFDSREISVELECDQNMACFFDRDLVSGVLHSVLVHCCRYAEKKICLSAIKKDQQLLLTVQDDSRGYPEFLTQAIPSIDRQDSQSSSQLAMSIAQEIALLHHRGKQKGSIQLSNNEIGGVFELSLP